MKIHCSYTEKFKTSALDTMRHPKNPKGHGASQIAAIAAVFEGNGIRAPIVVSKRSNLITRGHGRLDAALMLGYEEFPVDYQDYDSEAAEIADMIADNRLSELGELDNEKLLQVLSELSNAGHDVNLAGFSEDDLASLANTDEETTKLQEIPRMALQPFEHFDYLVFMFRDIRDWLRVLQLMKIVKVDYSITRKTQKIGIGRVLNGKTLLGQLENPSRHHVEGQSGPNDNPPDDPQPDAGRSV